MRRYGMQIWLKTFLFGVFGTVLFLLLGFTGTPRLEAAPPMPNPFVDIIKKASPGVVNIDTETLVTQNISPLFRDPLFREFFGKQFEEYSRRVPMRGRGSGFIVNKEGYILTNAHVIADADSITVTLSDGREFEAKLVGTDPTFDLGVLKIEASNLPTLDLGDSEALDVGEYVLAIGNPYGLEHSVTMGVISAKNRSIHAGEVHFQGFLQTDAAINPGNSGGPLLDVRGKVVGINTAIIPFAQGIGFAIPSNMARQVLQDLMMYGRVNRGWLGASIQPVTKEVAEAYGLDSPRGALVSDIMPNSPAEKAGLRRGDIITKVGKKRVESSQDLVFLIRSHLAGDRVDMEIFRDGKSEILPVRLDPLPGEEKPSSKPLESLEKTLGITVEPMGLEDARKRGVPGGMIIRKVAPNSRAGRVGLREGDVILEVNGRTITDTISWQRAMEQVNKALVFLISREGRTFFVSLRIE